MHTPVERRRVNAGEWCDSLAVWCDSLAGARCDRFSGKNYVRTAHRNGSLFRVAFIDVSTVAAANDLETYVINTSERTYARVCRVSLGPSVRSSYTVRCTIADAKRRVRMVVTGARLLYISETRVNEGKRSHGRRRKTKGCSLSLARTGDCAHRTEPIFHGAECNLVD